MNIRIKTFAVLKNYLQEEFEIQLETGSNVLDVIEHLDKLNPKANHILSHSLVAVGEEMVDKTTKLREGDLVCILPPVSGG
ncbi:MAG: MoaD/ThiS family protein [Leptospiraceae bacterium]|nr:MoaD/ThiS family protein [Leptospiraceae bacterium]